MPGGPASYAPRPQVNYRDPPPVEVYTLPDAANLSIPPEVREQYQRDEFGRVLFFTTPPVGKEQEIATRGHSVRYLAKKARQQETLSKKRKEREYAAAEAQREAKKARVQADEGVATSIETMKAKALRVLDKQLATAVAAGLGEMEMEQLSEAQKTMFEANKLREENAKRREAMRSIRLGSTFFTDDWDSRITQ
jgi:chromatin structure-remodeling complex subunit RSC1/2